MQKMQFEPCTSRKERRKLYHQVSSLLLPLFYEFYLFIYNFLGTGAYVAATSPDPAIGPKRALTEKFQKKKLVLGEFKPGSHGKAFNDLPLSCEVVYLSI
jgi:hypothetical protein